MAPFDAVLVIAFGGPQGPADIRPFLQNVLRGRSVPPERVEEVARHYEQFGGVSPLTDLTMRQAAGLSDRLARAGRPLPVHVGMRNWHPLLDETLREMAASGVRRAIGFIAAAHRSYSSCAQYRQNVVDARAALVASGLPDVHVTYVGDWHAHDGFIDANARHVQAARRRLPQARQDRARLIFTAHSLPSAMPGADVYVRQLRESASLVAARAGFREWALVYQSRSGRPEDSWLGPDICDVLKTDRSRGLEAVVVCPIGFVCDHVEVLWDLDREAAEVCAGLDLPMVRAAAVNDDPAFLDLMADEVLRVWQRYDRGLPLPIVPAAPAVRREGPPPAQRRPAVSS